jgi:hypothetical protein
MELLEQEVFGPKMRFCDWLGEQQIRLCRHAPEEPNVPKLVVGQLLDRNHAKANPAQMLMPKPLVKQIAGLVVGTTPAQDFLQKLLPARLEAKRRDQGLVHSERRPIGVALD